MAILKIAPVSSHGVRLSSTGGLYHVSDPLLILRKLRAVTREGGWFILQTSEILPLPGSWAQFWWLKALRSPTLLL
jgi:hypothetical protein